jgi:ribosomal protein L40E
MDGDLFQGVLLGLQAIGIIVLVALLATLGGIRKALEQRASDQPQPSGVTEADLGAAQQQVSPVQTTQTPGGSAQADTIRGVLHQHGLQGGQEPAASAPAASATPAQEQTLEPQGVGDSVFAAHADDPQEEPFQREGRWWFRRGDEILLYDEATGQWQPAPDESGASAAGAPVATQTQSVATTQATPVAADQVATYWKCVTCGAVNGSTAATCRMCFAARP